ncbi:MAG: winged helix-turn-helix domain-containing protein [Candidatus Micrarchaeota archaeon]
MPAQSEEQKVILDSSSFKALASETRVLILKELDKKRSTASELAKALGISVQAASEHLENLRVAGLVERADEGRKWVYFQLTEKGKTVVHPESGKRLWVLLSLFILVAAGAGFLILQGSFFGTTAALQDSAPAGAFAVEDSAERAALTAPAGEAAPKLMAALPANETNATNSSVS